MLQCQDLAGHMAKCSGWFYRQKNPQWENADIWHFAHWNCWKSDVEGGKSFLFQSIEEIFKQRKNLWLPVHFLGS